MFATWRQWYWMTILFVPSRVAKPYSQIPRPLQRPCQSKRTSYRVLSTHSSTATLQYKARSAYPLAARNCWTHHTQCRHSSTSRCLLSASVGELKPQSTLQSSATQSEPRCYSRPCSFEFLSSPSPASASATVHLFVRDSGGAQTFLLVFHCP